LRPVPRTVAARIVRIIGEAVASVVDAVVALRYGFAAFSALSEQRAPDATANPAAAAAALAAAPAALAAAAAGLAATAARVAAAPSRLIALAARTATLRGAGDEHCQDEAPPGA